MLENFRTYQLSKQFYQVCKTISAPKAVKDQLDRASLSVVLNLAEGCAKASPKDRRRFYAISLASFRECQAVLDILNKETELKNSDRLGACLYKLATFAVPET